MTNFLLSLIPLSILCATFELTRIANELSKTNLRERNKRRTS